MSRWANKYVIGLTGNIAVGKSVVRQMLQHLGTYTIDADGLAHQAITPGAPAYKPVVETFGQFILNDDKSINRAMLGNIVFTSPVALEKLEAITHPIVMKAINTLVSRAKQRVVVIEAIKLLDGDLADAIDVVWVVDANPDTQLKRLMGKQRKMSETAAKQRIAAQSPQADKLSKANVVIHNDGNVEDTWKQVQIGWREIRKLLTSAPPAKPATPKPVIEAAPPEAPAAEPAAPKPTVEAAPPEAPAAEPAAPKPVVKTAPPETPAAEPAVSEVSIDEEIPVSKVVGDTGIAIRRGMPGNAGNIATFINKLAGKEISRMDVMMAFGEKSYLLAQDSSDNVVALMGFQVENLITRVDEFYLEKSAPKKPVIEGLMDAIEEASKDLQSEVGFIFLPKDAPQDTVQPFLNNDYKVTTIDEIKIPAWREAVQELITDEMQVLRKQLRKDRVLKPI